MPPDPLEEVKYTTCPHPPSNCPTHIEDASYAHEGDTVLWILLFFAPTGGGMEFNRF